MITEGLVIYLPEQEVASLARDLAGETAFQRWIVDIASPGLREMMQKQFGAQTEQGLCSLSVRSRPGAGVLRGDGLEAARGAVQPPRGGPDQAPAVLAADLRSVP